MVKIFPSLASAPMMNLAEVIKDLEIAGADGIHFDLEDGCFVPMMTLGTRIIQQLRSLTPLIFDVHLCMKNPEYIIPDIVEMGADRISVHIEACSYPHRVLKMIHEKDKIAGLAINPGTPLPDLRYLLSYLDYVLVLTTEPEYPDAHFLPEVLDKVRRGRQMYKPSHVEWVVDGGVTEKNVKAVVTAGASIVVIGRSIYRDGAIVENLRGLRFVIEDE